MNMIRITPDMDNKPPSVIKSAPVIKSFVSQLGPGPFGPGPFVSPYGSHGPHGPRAQGQLQTPKRAPTQPAALGPWARGAHGTHRVIQMCPGQTGPGLIESQMALALAIASF